MQDDMQLFIIINNYNSLSHSHFKTPTTLMVLPIGHWQVGGWNTWTLGTRKIHWVCSCVFFLTFF